jgi:hypothetical protein
MSLLLRSYILEERITSIIRVRGIGELGTTLAVTSSRSMLIIGNIVPSLPILVTLTMEAICSSETWFLQEPHGATSQKTAFFIVTAVKTTNLTMNSGIRILVNALKLCKITATLMSYNW